MTRVLWGLYLVYANLNVAMIMLGTERKPFLLATLSERVFMPTFLKKRLYADSEIFLGLYIFPTEMVTYTDEAHYGCCGA